MAKKETEFSRGWEACSAGDGVNTNPHESGTREWHEWRDGWLANKSGVYTPTEEVRGKLVNEYLAEKGVNPVKGTDPPVQETGVRYVVLMVGGPFHSRSMILPDHRRTFVFFAGTPALGFKYRLEQNDEGYLLGMYEGIWPNLDTEEDKSG